MFLSPFQIAADLTCPEHWAGTQIGDWFREPRIASAPVRDNRAAHTCQLGNLEETNKFFFVTQLMPPFCVCCSHASLVVCMASTLLSSAVDNIHIAAARSPPVTVAAQDRREIMVHADDGIDLAAGGGS